MKQHGTTLGMNRTGMQMSPLQSQALLEATEQTVPSSEGDETSIASVRMEYTAQAGEVGSVPLPATVQAALKSSVDMLTGKRTQVFLDKLGERLAYERSGTRLYDAVITKCEARISEFPELPLDTLRRIRNEEAQHFALLTDAMIELGADPTAQTPSADVVGVASMGLMQVATDPRTVLAHGLHVLLIAELEDNAAWESLIELAEQFGRAELAERFRVALAEEAEHLATIRSLHDQAVVADSSLLGAKAARH